MAPQCAAMRLKEGHGALMVLVTTIKQRAERPAIGENV